MRIVLVISSLDGAGGAERVMATLANGWVIRNHEVFLITFDDGTQPLFYELSNRIVHVPLSVSFLSKNLLFAVINNLKRVSKIRKIINDLNPDIIISFLTSVNIITILSTIDLNIPVVVSERNNPQRMSLNNVWKILRSITYRYAKIIVVQTDSIKNYFPVKLKRKITIIPNPVLVPSFEKFISCSLKKNSYIVSMASLTPQKALDVLIIAYSKICQNFPTIDLVIIGEGPLRSELVTLTVNLGIESRVKFLGKIKNPAVYLKNSVIFVMTSLFEGFPNALCEAMACGIPVISTDCGSGPRDIVRNGYDGLLVPPENIEFLSAAMNELLSDPAKRKKLGVNALEITERFSLSSIMDLWDDVFYKCNKNNLKNFLKPKEVQ